MTFEEAEKEHKKLWDWLAKTGTKSKLAYPGFRDIDPPINLCFACELVGETYDYEMRCMVRASFCPIKWVPRRQPGYTPCVTLGSLYQQWHDVLTREERQDIAAKIRDLPWTKK